MKRISVLSKRFFCLLFAALLILGLAACGSKGGETAADISIVDAETSTAPQTTAASENTAAEKTSVAPETTAAERSTAAEPETTAAPETETAAPETETESEETEAWLPEDGEYSSKDEVALYIHLYGHLPSNYITKREAEKLGWTGGSLEPYAPGKAIGGGRFGNYEGLLPEAPGRTYTECDIDTVGASKRGAKRIVFSNDGLIYYTDDHYESFELLYGEE